MEHGSDVFKAGSAGKAAPSAKFLSTLDRYTMPSIKVDTGQKECYFRAEALVVEDGGGICKAGFAGGEVSTRHVPLDSVPRCHAS